jgi:Leucine-rich repeat (LRR) protein
MKMFRFMKFRTIFVFTLLTFLVGCSSSSENSDAPVVDALDHYSVMERDPFSYKISTSDSDGSVVTHEIRQVSGTDVEITGSLSFVAPSVVMDEELIFEFIATDNVGASTKKIITVLVQAYSKISDVAFEDARLQACFDFSVEKNIIESESDIYAPPIILWADVGDVLSLGCIGYEVADISGISQLPGLKSLYIGHDENISELSDISELGKLTDLTSLFLYNDKVTDISVLSSLVNLNTVHLKGIQPTNLYVLSELEELSFLHLVDVPITMPSFLSDITKLKSLLLDNNGITDIQALSELTNMEELRLFNNDISTFQPLERLTKITLLKVNKVPVIDISSLSNMINLQTLKLFETAVTDISLLAELTELTGVSIGKSPVTDMSPLAQLDKLEVLAWNDLPITDINVLVNFTYLKKLMFADGMGVDISPIKTLTDLDELRIELDDSFGCDELASLQGALLNTEVTSTLECI